MEKSNKKFIICAVGVFMAYFYFGILQEKIIKGKYTYETVDKNGNKLIETEKFNYVLTLVFVQCAINYLVAYVSIYVWPHKEDKTERKYYISVAATYLLAMISSNMALRWIPYPTQVVGKSAKPIPVMIFGVLLGRKSYTFRKYLFVFLIVIGMVLFMFKEKVASQNELNFGMGELLLILSLAMDGLTGAVQERIRAESSPSGHQMMKATNAYSCIFLAVALVITGEAFVFPQFASRHFRIIYNLLALGLTQAIGQLFLYVMVSDFGPLTVSIVTTTRKLFTVLTSVLLFGNSLSVRQWLGAATVFSGLFLDMFFAKGKPAPQKKQKEDGKKLLKK